MNFDNGAFWIAMAAATIGAFAFGGPLGMIVPIVFWIAAPGPKITIPIPDRPLTDAEARIFTTRILTAHLESNAHADGDCGDDCPVPDLLRQINRNTSSGEGG